MEKELKLYTNERSKNSGITARLIKPDAINKYPEYGVYLKFVKSKRVILECVVSLSDLRREANRDIGEVRSVADRQQLALTWMAADVIKWVDGIIEK